MTDQAPPTPAAGRTASQRGRHRPGMPTVRQVVRGMVLIGMVVLAALVVSGAADDGASIDPALGALTGQSAAVPAGVDSPDETIPSVGRSDGLVITAVMDGHGCRYALVAVGEVVAQRHSEGTSGCSAQVAADVYGLELDD